MGDVSISEDGIVIEAALIAQAFRISAERVREDMRAGRITSRCETGTGSDEGRWRMTFLRDGRAFRFVVDSDGNVLSRSSFPAKSLAAG
ncbi:DUF6522 family protein [uncultured Mameliella sp.]|uniref:DUF6522 family protein n=1 Tax=uncultured Mameliella sp. TaxID=1447087 RepID=UPI0026246138|nr:DUF6522 family protein [uncultured Mameliella sp.]